MNEKKTTSWNKVAPWYDNLVSTKGHYYHKEVILPHLIPLIYQKKKISILDLGCGQGILSRCLKKDSIYYGVDIASDLIESGKKKRISSSHHFYPLDATGKLDFDKKDFTHATLILAYQNMENPKLALMNAKRHLKEDGSLIMVINHPCFRIPKHSFWETDRNGQRYRKIDRYLSPFEVEIEMNPGKDNSEKTISFHYSLSQISSDLKEAGFAITSMHELCSNKKSVGIKGETENFSRREFPLFLTIEARCVT